MQQFTGDGAAAGLKVAVVVSKFNEFVTGRLQDGAVAALKAAGVAENEIAIVAVPGAFEIPFAAKEVARARSVDAVVCLGCLIRGATAHFEYIASACAHGITSASLDTGVPMTFGVLTTNSVEEALERSVEGAGNKGWEAAVAAVEMALLQRSMRAAAPGGRR